MEAEKVERSGSPSSSSPKRKPLSDSTNLLIPTPTILRKLSSSLSTTPPFRNSKPYNSKPYNPDTNSDTSIGSSNHNPNPSTTFKTHPSTPSPLSISIPGNLSLSLSLYIYIYTYVCSFVFQLWLDLEFVEIRGFHGLILLIEHQ
ncbi:hypothetical protein CsSME_00045482 [Camellia sinensis var. sinensis]